MLDLELFDGPYYLAGYSVECAIKSCIAKKTKRWEFPEKKRVDSSYSHDLKDLLRVAGLSDEQFKRAKEETYFLKNWEIVQSWSEQSRYRRSTKDSTRQIIEAIRDRQHGVISWLKLHW